MRPSEERHETEADPIAAVRRHPWIVLFTALIFAALGGFFAVNQPAAFSAQAGIVVEDARSSSLLNSRSTDAERYVADQVAILESRVVAERAAELAAAQDPPLELGVDDFLSNTTISSSGESNFITIAFVASTANEATAGANAIGLSYEQVIAAALAEDAQTAVAELDDAIDAAVEEIAALQNEIETLRTDNDERVQLDDQLAEIVTALVELRVESAALEATEPTVQPDPGDGGTAEELRQAALSEVNLRIQQLTEELRARLLVADVEAQVPATAFVLRQQQDAATRLSELTLRRSQIEVDARLAGNGVAFFTPAGPGTPRRVPTRSTVALMAAVGALVGAAIAYWLSQRRSYVTDRLTPQAILDAPLLAEVPEHSKAGAGRRNGSGPGAAPDMAAMLPVLHNPTSAQAEAFRILVGGLTQRLQEARRQAASVSDTPQRGMVIAVCSPVIGEGKTMVAANTALAAGRAGLRVVLVDGDFGAQDATRLVSQLPVQARPVGLTEVVGRGIRLEDAVMKTDVGAGGQVGVLARGHGDVAAPELFGSQATGQVLAQLAEWHDFVIIDLPPLLQVAYATAALQKADRALVVVRHGSPIDSLRELRYRLDLVGVAALGYVYTAAPLRRSMTRAEGPSGDVLGSVTSTT